MTNEEITALLAKLPDDQKAAYNALTDDQKKTAIAVVDAALKEQKPQITAIGIPVFDTSRPAIPEKGMWERAGETAVEWGVIVALVLGAYAGKKAIDKVFAPTPEA